ncbi:MAG TPA: GntR family transcriptional regulator [Bryobacteraceae bacterium]|nr:GntR family transcriptional regulator [Bryobacteraceae bacterium]
MRIWISKRSGIPLADQIANQLVLAMASGDLAPGQRLPSIRALAARLDVHANTIRAAYLELERRDRVHTRQGSGVYVAAPPEPAASPQLLARSFVDRARAAGFSDDHIRQEFDAALRRVKPDHVTIVEPERELGEVMAAEIASSTGIPARWSPIRVQPDEHRRSLHACLRGRAAGVSEHLPPGTSLVVLNTVSIEKELEGKQRPSQNTLIAVVSSSAELLRYASSVLLGAGVDPQALLQRDPSEPGWDRGLNASTFVIADIVSARKLPSHVPVELMRVIAESSLDELRARWEEQSLL